MPYLCLILAACFWGGNYVIGHILVESIDPILLSAARWILTAALLMLLYRRQVALQWPAMKKSMSTVVFLAMCGQVLFPITLYIGLQYTSSLNAAIYLSTTPALVLIINKIFFKERIAQQNIWGVALSSIGVAYLILQGDFTRADALASLNRGDLWTMGSAVSWALYCAFLRIKPKEIKGNAFVAVSAAIGAIALLPALLFSLQGNAPIAASGHLQYGLLAGVAYLVIFPSWLSYLLWNKGILAIGSTRGEIYSHLIPLSGGILSIVFLREPTHAFHLVSAMLIACGIALCSLAKHGQSALHAQAKASR
ncbi:DMT family transporter [Chromobacterium phragmitis]|uniref:DMT family transporter n=1 Tax=Chromobacterium phragmitis TaxID=2202141 RepID=A0ABV0IRL3_9NEIS